jgi:hypothetical protein
VPDSTRHPAARVTSRAGCVRIAALALGFGVGMLVAPAAASPCPTDPPFAGVNPLDQLGATVAMSADGTVALVGQPGSGADDGLVRSFTRVGDGWVEGSPLGPEPAFATGAEFGRTLAMSDDGTVAVVGAPNDRNGLPALQLQGSITIFERGLGDPDWTRVVRLTEPEPQPNRGFGERVAISGDGDTIVVWQSNTNTGSLGQSDSIWLVQRDGLGWSDPAELPPIEPVTGSEQFGRGIALSADGRWLAASSIGADALSCGRVFLWERPGGVGTPYVPRQVVGHAATGAECSFGWSIRFLGDQLLVSDPRSALAPSVPPGIDTESAGAVWVLEQQAGIWTTLPDPILMPPAGSGGPLVPQVVFFGSVLGGRGDQLLVVAPDFVEAGTFEIGSVLRYRRENGAWSFVDQTVGMAATTFGDLTNGVDLSDDGSRWIVGDPYGGASIFDGGRARFLDAAPGTPAPMAVAELESVVELDVQVGILSLVDQPVAFDGTLTFEVLPACDGGPGSVRLVAMSFATTEDLSIELGGGVASATSTNASMTLAPGAALPFVPLADDGTAVLPPIPCVFGGTIEWTIAGTSGTEDLSTLEPLPLAAVQMTATEDSGGRLDASFEFGVAGPIDLGLGPFNPQFMADGTVVAEGTDAPAPCPGDLDASGDVGFGDVLIALGDWGACGDPCPADLDGDGSVAFGDVLELLAAWGPCG